MIFNLTYFLGLKINKKPSEIVIFLSDVKVQMYWGQFCHRHTTSGPGHKNTYTLDYYQHFFHTDSVIHSQISSGYT